MLQDDDLYNRTILNKKAFLLLLLEILDFGQPTAPPHTYPSSLESLSPYHNAYIIIIIISSL